MLAFIPYVTIPRPGYVALTNRPFCPSQGIGVAPIGENQQRALLADRLRGLFRETQALPVSGEITEAEPRYQTDPLQTD